MRWALVLLAGCYRPATPVACAITCDGLTPCPAGLTCTAAGVCAGSADEDACPLADGGPADDQGDASVMLTDCYSYLNSSSATICVEPPSGTLELGDTTPGPAMIDTDAFACAPYDATPMVDACVVAADRITIRGTLRGVGSRPLVLIGRTAVEVGATATLDVSSKSGVGSGSRKAEDCPVFSLAPGGGDMGGGGGAGGSFGSFGGAGGAGAAGAVGGGAANVTVPTVLIGGCAGMDGGAAVAANRGARGAGGGAVALLSKDRVTVLGSINASGQAGGGGVDGNAGGGGGGSGGMIVLFTPAEGTGVTIGTTANVWALGAGGGGGATTTPGSSGEEPPDPITPGRGGMGENGANGGSGACCATEPGDQGIATSGNSGGGGGGGGGLGRLVLGPKKTVLTSRVTPNNE